MEECQHRSHQIPQLFRGIVDSSRSRSSGDQTFRCICSGAYQAGGGLRLRHAEDPKRYTQPASHWWRSNQSSVIFIAWWSLAVLVFWYYQYFCCRKVDFRWWDSKSGGRICDPSLSFGVSHLGQALYLTPIMLTCSMWSANQDVGIGQQRHSSPSEHGHRAPELMSSASGHRVTSSNTILAISHITCLFISLWAWSSDEEFRWNLGGTGRNSSTICAR